MNDGNALEAGPLPYPVFFVLREYWERWKDVLEGDSRLPNPAEVHDRLSGTQNSWLVQTYLYLRRSGFDVHLVTDYVPGEINITSYRQCGGHTRTDKCFVVCCRGDRGVPHLCEMTVVQNPTNVRDSRRDFFLPLWPQPGLIPRDESRGDRIENVVYYGAIGNLDPAYKGPEFTQQLEALNLRLVSNEHHSGDPSGVDYRDYRNTDIVLAIRNLTRYDATVKPPSKLVNAWLAGSPAILGPESAFRAIRRSELDYLEARNTGEVLRHLRYLIDNPDVYRAMRDNARARAPEVGPQEVQRQWIHLLCGAVADRFRDWKAANALTVSLWRPAQFALRLAHHKAGKAIHEYRATHGPRICDDYADDSIMRQVST